MKQSLTYHITLLVIKLKGVKKYFSKDPIDFKKIRRKDIHHPKDTIFRQNQVRNFKISNTSITEVKRNKMSNDLLIFIHGGAFISGPAQHHWDTTRYKKLSNKQIIQFGCVIIQKLLKIRFQKYQKT